MASPVAAYPNSAASQSKKNSAIELVHRLDIPSHARSIAMEAAIDLVCFVAFLVVLFMVPA